MRFYRKYKDYCKVFYFFKKFPKIRLLKFKRSKWKKLQALLTKRTFKKRQFINILQVKLRYKRWEKLKASYAEALQLKRAIFKLFDNAVSLSSFKKLSLQKTCYNKKNLVINSLIYPLYQLDILLWKLNFFKSVFQAGQEINNKHILVNAKKISNNFLVKRGDIITFSNIFVEKLNIKSCEFLYSFLEVDYIAKTVIILKDFSELSKEDLRLLAIENILFPKLINYIKLK